MLGADNLFLLERKLDNLNEQNPEEMDVLRKILEQIYNLYEYKEWLKDGQFAPSSDLSGRFILPTNFGIKLKDKKWLLEGLGLVNGGLLEVKIASACGKIHLTDGSWVDPKVRVYPFTSESNIICDYFYANPKGEPDLLIDPACGCGHHSLGLDTIPEKVSFDINLRALAYARINALLNDMSQMLTGLNDLRNGLPKSLNTMTTKETLITINMPFAIFPRDPNLSNAISLTKDGGDLGVAFTLASFRDVKELVDHADNMQHIRCIIQFYSLGNVDKDEWEVVEYARELFGLDTLSYNILSNEKMWRVNGKKEQSNPMPLDRLKLKADCRHTFSESRAENARKGYIELENLFRKNGYTHLSYILMDIECK